MFARQRKLKELQSSLFSNSFDFEPANSFQSQSFHTPSTNFPHSQTYNSNRQLFQRSQSLDLLKPNEANRAEIRRNLNESKAGYRKTETSTTPANEYYKDFVKENKFEHIIKNNFRDSKKDLKELKEPQLIEYELSGLPAEFSPRDLRKLCPKLHIVSASTETDTLLGECKGKGRVMLRANRNNQKEHEEFEMKLLSKGIEIKSYDRTLSSNLQPRSPRMLDFSRKNLDPSHLTIYQWGKLMNPRAN